MIYNLYSIRDVKTRFSDPVSCASDEAAKRSFAYFLNNWFSDSKKDFLGLKPCDFQLWSIGCFDSSTGEVSHVVPEMICDGTAFPSIFEKESVTLEE